MKGLGRLIRNELIKIFGQLSWKIITALILVLAIASPILSMLVNKAFNIVDDYYYNEYENAEEGSLVREYYGAFVRTDSLFNDNGITHDDWRYSVYYESVAELEQSVTAFELIKDGADIAEVFEWFYFGDVDVSYGDDGQVSSVNYYDEAEGEYVPLTKELATALYHQNNAELELLKDEVVNGTIASYAESRIKEYEEYVDSLQPWYDEAKAAFEANPDKAYDFYSAHFDMYVYKAAINVWDSVKNASREDEEWLLSTAEYVSMYENRGAFLSAVSREEYEKNVDLSNSYSSYEKYCELMDKQYNDNIASLDILMYSAKNGMPIPEIVNGSVRNDIMVAFNDNASIVLLMCIILAASIVASDHMAGTVRLLLIRPRARWKILLSKLIAVVIYGLAVFAASSVISIALNVAISGVGDLSVPVLLHRGGTVKEVSPWIYMIVKTLISALPDIFILSLAFFLSVLMKKIVFAVTIPMLITMFGTIASSLTMLFHLKFPIIEWTLLPYFVIDGYTEHVVTRTATGYGYDLVSMGYELEVGIVLLLLTTAIFTALSFIVFKHQQVKN